jgi:hypothetical protein
MIVTSLRKALSRCFKPTQRRAAELRDHIKYLRERELTMT